MALLHAAELHPSKADAVASLLAGASWGPRAGADLELVGAFRFDDPDGAVGIETHLARAGGALWQAALTYRDAPLGVVAEVITLKHSVLGTRWVHDGAHDPAYLALVATAALTGTGQAAELRTAGNGRRSARESAVRLSGGGWSGGWVPVDGWGAPEQDGDDTVLTSPEWTLRLVRRLGAAPTGEGYELTGTWPGQDEPALLARVQARD